MTPIKENQTQRVSMGVDKGLGFRVKGGYIVPIMENHTERVSIGVYKGIQPQQWRIKRKR